MSEPNEYERVGHEPECTGVLVGEGNYREVQDGTCTCGADQDGRYDIGCC